jgi:hypothetical protein
MATIIGDAGVGKSRLIAELKELAQTPRRRSRGPCGWKDAAWTWA